MAAKETDTSKKQTENDVVTEVPQEPVTTAEPVAVAPAAPEQATDAKSKRQSLIIGAIVGGVLLFLLGMACGYTIGHAKTTTRMTFPTNGQFTPPEDGGGRRFYPNSGTNDNSTNGSSGSSNSDTQTQTN